MSRASYVHSLSAAAPALALALSLGLGTPARAGTDRVTTAPETASGATGHATLLAATTVTLQGRARVVDGDTLDIAGQKVRLFGIDAPETAQRCNGLPCGKEATAFLQDMLQGEAVTCEGDEYDAYDRLLAHCFVGKQDISGTMVSAGHAAAFVRYSDAYLPLQVEAYETGRGMWQNGMPQMPWDYRSQRWQTKAQEAPRPGCPIKGNINARGQRIYHTPYSQFYDQTIIRTEYGERWFCSEAEALAAGWRAPLQ